MLSICHQDYVVFNLLLLISFLYCCVCVKCITLCNCLCSFLLLLLLLVTLPALIRISENSDLKTILQTIEQLIQYTLLEIQFRSFKYTDVIRIRKNLCNLPFLSKRYKARTENVRYQRLHENSLIAIYGPDS